MNPIDFAMKRPFTAMVAVVAVVLEACSRFAACPSTFFRTSTSP